MSSYLSHRTQYVVIGAQNSRMSAVSTGVPQGSVLGPLLYSMYTNEISEVIKDDLCTDPTHDEDNFLFTPNCHKCGIIPFYADDTTILHSSNSRSHNQYKIVNNLKLIKEFLNDNNLTINMSKTNLLEVMVKQKHVRTPGAPPHILTKDKDGNNKVITAGCSLRLLGCNLQDNLSWQSHLSTGEKALLPITRQKLGALKHIGRYLSRTSRHILATGMILSRIQYLIQIWGGTERKYIKKVQTLLNATARFVTGKSRRTSTRNLMTSCNWLYAREMASYFSMITMWNVIHRQVPHHMFSNIDIDADLRLHTQPARLQITGSSFRWQYIPLWNSLEDDIRLNGSLPSFKRKLKKWIISQRTDPG